MKIRVTTAAATPVGTLETFIPITGTVTITFPLAYESYDALCKRRMRERLIRTGVLQP